jgi:hypothetical protein
MSNTPPVGDQPGWPNPSQNPPPPPAYGGSYGNQGGYGSPGGYGNQGGYGGSSPRNGIGIAAMVVGIVAIFLFWIPLLGLVLAIVALVLGIVGIRKASRGEATNKGMAIAGVVTGALALLGSIFITIVFFVAVDEFGSLFECLEQAQTIEEQESCQVQFEQEVNR